jgi:Family of unknown function (DUF6412)
VGVRLRFALAVLLPALFALLPAAGPVGPLGALTAGLAVAGLAAVAVVVLVQLVPEAAPAQVRTVGLRERSRQAAFLRLRDPDAPGRPRPRAPGSRSTAV